MPQNPPFGHLEPTGRHPEVQVVEPVWCAAGHRLQRGKVTVSWVDCLCERARNGGHYRWLCQLDGRRMYGDGHVDDSLLRG